uniref:Uncharacterized protein n=1 Tax=Setaria viridis TaxID=4556 RepID=A0A4U6W5Q2_SETVI|nr:hypothetical protein SEVIR_1G026150v2 [Setaria viridis]
MLLSYCFCCRPLWYCLFLVFSGCAVVILVILLPMTCCFCCHCLTICGLLFI